MASEDDRAIRLRGAREHNLQNVDVDIPLGGITVVTGPSGSGKTSLAMGTLYAEGQRRYVETFSPYVRQFMDRMDRPDVDAVENILPAIALGQRNSVKNSRSTVGTMTGMNEYLKLIFSRMAVGHDAAGNPVRPSTPQSVAEELLASPEQEGADALICFAVKPVGSFEEMCRALEGQGYLRVFAEGADEVVRLAEATEAQLGMERWLVVQDRIRLRAEARARLTEALENALRLGQDVAFISLRGEDGKWAALRSFRSDWHPLVEPRPGLFSGNSPLGACPACKGYGRAISYDYMRGILPDKTIKDGALKMLSSQTLSECFRDFVRANKLAKAVRMNVPWHELSKREQDWVIYGEAPEMDVWEAYHKGLWYGYKGITDDMEKHAHKLSARVFLAYYRVYSVCPACHGGRLRPEALAFTIGACTVPEVQAMPMEELRPWLETHVLPHTGADRSLQQAVRELYHRVAYLCEVGLGYIAANRLTRSLSGGEIERVSLTACLGAALTETLFVLDEPTVGLHARDTARLIGAMRRLAERGNTLVVVEHEEAVMRAADYVVDMGPGSGAAGGRVVYAGEPAGMLQAAESLTGAYLGGTKRIELPQKRRRPKKGQRLSIIGATCHNLRDFIV